MASPDDTADTVLAIMRGRRYDTASMIAVCRGDVLVGLATVERLLAADGHDTISSIMDANPPKVLPGTDQEHAAWQAVQYGVPGLAVVDAGGRFHGLISPQRLLGVLIEEHDEDLARLGGFLRTTASARAASEESVRRRLWHRTPWLGVGLVGALLSAGLLGNFSAQLAGNVSIAYFIPGIVYLADAVGTQTETVAIRGLSVGVGIGRIAGREALTGLLVGLLLAAVMMPIISVVWGDIALAAAVAVAVLAASTIATLVAMVLPWLLLRLGTDPAFGSGPLATVVQDLLSIIIYLGVVSLLVP